MYTCLYLYIQMYISTDTCIFVHTCARSHTPIHTNACMHNYGVSYFGYLSCLTFSCLQVLSGTETGTVLVWDGGLIKCQLRRPGGLSCHDGMIEFLQLDEKENEMLTAGADGRVRFWSLKVHPKGAEQLFDFNMACSVCYHILYFSLFFLL